jgi:hypothetical protein
MIGGRSDARYEAEPVAGSADDDNTIHERRRSGIVFLNIVKSVYSPNHNGGTT